MMYCINHCTCILCTFQTAEEGVMKASNNRDPYLLCVGSAENVSSCVVVCNNKVITDHISKRLLPCAMVLLAVYYCFNLEYNSKVKPALEFLQEKLLRDRLPANRKVTRSYEQLYRALDCIENKMAVEDNKGEDDEDATQIECNDYMH